MTRRPLCLALLAGLAATGAHAAPPALDHVPEGAAMVAAVDNIGELGARLQALIERLGMDDAARQVSMATMTVGGFGVKPDGSAALVVMDGDLEALESGQGPIALIAEFTDYNGFITNFGGDPEADIAEFSMQGSPAFARDLGGGWVALGPDRATVEGIEGAGGLSGPLGRWAGAVGREIADDSNLVVMIDVQAMRPMIERGMQEMEEGLAEAEAMGAQGAMGADLARGFIQSFLNDARVGVIGMHIDDAGVAIDLAAQFEDGSDLAGYFQEEGNASGLMGHLPKVPVLFAGAFDASHAGVQKMIGQLGELRERLLPDAPPNQMVEMLASADGGAVVIGNSPALLSGGVFSNSALYLATDDPGRVMEANEHALEVTDGMEQPGMTMQTSYTHNALTVAGAEVDSWSMAMELDPDSPMAQQMSRGLMGLFGPTGGPSGYMAEIDGGVVGTLSQNRRLLESAINAARAGNGLSEGEEIAEAAGTLRGGNIAEVYIGVGNILNTVTSVMGMMGMDMDVEIPDDIGAVPLSVGSMDGGVRFRTFLPTDVIVTVSELSAYFQQMQGGMNPMGGDEWEEDADDESGF